MADVNANISVNIDTSTALAELKSLQRQLALFHSSVAKSSAAASLAQGQLQRELLNTVNATGKFAATMVNIRTSTESFTHALETNKLGMREYFRYAGGATKTFGKLFRSEFDTISKVSEERVKKMQTQYIKMGRDANGVVKAMAIKPLVLDMGDYGTQTQLAAQRQALFNQLVRQGSTNLLNFGKNTQWAGRQLMVGFTIPLLAVATQASRTFMEMETAALKFRKVYGDLFTPQEETQAALNNIKELGTQFTKYGIAVSDTVALAAEAAAAGFQGVDLQRQTTAATRLSVLGQIESQQALETTISLQNAFRMSSEDLAGAIDFLNAVENQTVTSLDDITTAIPKVAPVIQQLGGDVKDLAFLLTAMKEGGVNASEGANALKSGLAALINPTKRASDMLAGMGINITKIIESNQGNLRATVVEFAQALDRLDPLTRARAIEQLFGKFQFARLSTLFDNVIRDGNQASRVLDLAGSSIEELAALSSQELGMTADSAMNKFRKSVEDLKVALQPVGEAFLQIVTPIIDFFGGILEKFSGLSDRTKKFITLMVVGIGGLGPVLLMTFGLLANGLANIIKLFLNLRNGYLRLTGQSKVLGEQTNYLTAEQLEAATVGASLNQTHSNLTQTFTIEASAVNALRNAYIDANLAAKEFAARNPGMMLPKRTKGYAEGIVSVPGPKGAGDVVPAMLSPGEAVIPAKMVQRYAPLIQGMVAGNIPGYELGRPGRGASGRVGKSNVTVLRSMLENISSVGGLVGIGGIDPSNIADVSSIYADEILKEAKINISLINKEITEWSQANRQAISAARDAVNSGIPAQEAYAELTQKFQLDMQEAGGAVHKFTETAQSIAPMLSQDLVEAQRAADRLGLNLKNADDALILAKELPGNILAQKAIKPGNYQARAKTRGAAASIFGGVPGIPIYGVPGFMTGAVEPRTPAYDVRSSQEHFIQTKEAQQNLLSNQQARKAGKENAMAYKSGVKSAGVRDIYDESSVRNSPHPRAYQDGKDDGLAYSKGRDSSMSLYGTNRENVDPIAKSIRRQKEKTMNDLAKERVITKTLLVSQLQQEKQLRESNARMATFNSKLMTGMFALTSLSGMASMAGGSLGQLSQVIFQITGPLFALSSIMQLLTGTKIAKYLKEFPLRVAGIGIAVSALVITFKLLNSAREEERKRLHAFGDTLKYTEKAAKRLGNFFQYQPTTSLLRSTPSTKVLGVQQKSAVEAFMASEDFKSSEVQSIVSAVSKLKTEKDVIAALTIAGYQMLSTGASKENVQVFIDSILEAAKKQDVVIDFKSLKIEKDNINDITKQLSIGLGKLGPAYRTGQTTRKLQFDTEGSNEKRTETITNQSKELKAEIANQAQTISTFTDSLSNAFQNGQIKSKTFLDSFKLLNTEISKNTPDSESAIKLLAQALSLTDPELGKIVKNIKNYSDAALVMQARALGIAVAQETLSLMTVKASGDLIIAAAQVAAVNDLEAQVLAKLKEITDKVKKNNDPNPIKTGTSALKERIEELKKQNKAFSLLIKNNVEYATALDIAGDKEMRNYILAAANAKDKGKSLREAIKLTKQLTQETEKMRLTEIAGQDQGDYEKSRLEMAQKYIEFQEHIIDMQNRPQLEKYDNEIKSINIKLDEISEKETKINDAYQEQVDALNQIKSINENINNLQKQRLSIADALTRGDISAAAQAIQDARAQQSSMSLEVAEQALAVGKENAISALGKKQLEAQVTSLQKQKKALEDNIQLQKDTIKYFGMTKTQIDDAVRALDLAKSAEININDPAFLNNILKGAKGDADALAKALAEVALQAKEAFLLLSQIRSGQMNKQTIFGGGSSYIGSQGGYDAAGRYVGTPFGQAPSTIGSSGGYDAAGTYVGTPFGQAMYGGFIKRMVAGGRVKGRGMTDKIPTLLTPGEYVINKNAAQRFAPLLKQINESKYPNSLSFGGTPVVAAASNASVNNSNTVYNYSLSVTANSDGASPDDIAKTVITYIKNLDSQRLRSNR